MIKRLKKIIPVKAAFSGNLRGGLEVVSASCKPAGVLIQGAEKIINTLEMIETKPISLDRRSASFTETISLELPEAPNISANTQRIDVRVEINEQIRTRQFLNIPLRVVILLILEQQYH